MSTAFYVVRLDNLIYLFNSSSTPRAGRRRCFAAVARVLFTFVVPLALMTTYPALALLGQLPARSVFADLAIAAAALLGSRLVFLRALRAYTSAGG